MTRKKPGATMGRPRKWKVETEESAYSIRHAESVIKLMSEGYFDYQIMAYLNITEKTWNKWIKDHEDFAHAIELGTPKLVHYLLTTGKEKLKSEGDKGIKTWTYIVDRILPKYMPGWEPPKSSKDSGNTINIHNMQVVNKGSQELLEDIRSNFSQLWEHQKIELLEKIPEAKRIIDIEPEQSEPREPKSSP